jgi:predicted nucleic acid-binding protein
MKYVLDSSVALKWVLPELDSAKALRLRADFQAGLHELIAPDIFPVEVGQALTKAERRKTISVGLVVCHTSNLG